VLGEHAEDEEDGVCTPDVCFKDLVLTEDKIFMEDGRTVGKVCHGLSSVEHVTEGTLGQ
jgi:hypothetical protein